MIKTIIFMWLHKRGFCTRYHRLPKEMDAIKELCNKNHLSSWIGACPLMDQVMNYLYPLKVVNDK